MTRLGCRLSAMVVAGALGVAAATAADTVAWTGKVPARDHARGNPQAERPEAVAAGALLYKDHCQQCHRANAEGDGHKRPTLRSERVRGATDGDIEWFLRQGNLAKGMPSWSSLPEAQRWQIIVYLRSLK